MARQLLVRNDYGEWTVILDEDRASIPDANAAFVIRETGDQLRIEDDVGVVIGRGARSADTIWIAISGEVFACRVSSGVAREAGGSRGHDVLTPPMPATVVRVTVRPGDRVAAGDTLVVLEAMKMELPIRAPRDATVTAVHCSEGQLVQPEQELIDLA